MEPTKASYNFESQSALYQVVDQLSGKMSDAFSECRLAPIQGTNGVMDGAGRFPAQGYSNLKPAMEHKDVLADGSGLDATSKW